jgi:hypothetical protein
MKQCGPASRLASTQAFIVEVKKQKGWGVSHAAKRLKMKKRKFLCMQKYRCVWKVLRLGLLFLLV